MNLVIALLLRSCYVTAIWSRESDRIYSTITITGSYI